MADEHEEEDDLIEDGGNESASQKAEAWIKDMEEEEFLREMEIMADLPRYWTEFIEAEGYSDVQSTELEPNRWSIRATPVEEFYVFKPWRVMVMLEKVCLRMFFELLDGQVSMISPDCRIDAVLELRPIIRKRPPLELLLSPEELRELRLREQRE